MFFKWFEVTQLHDKFSIKKKIKEKKNIYKLFTNERKFLFFLRFFFIKRKKYYGLFFLYDYLKIYANKINFLLIKFL